jgi:hypothetical protein
MVLWVNDPTLLMNAAHIKEVWPTAAMSSDDKLNAITRFVILATVLGFLVTRQIRFFVAGGLTLAAIAMYAPKKEGFAHVVPLSRHTAPTDSNPMMNVLLPEINDNPNRKKAMPSYTPQTNAMITQKVKQQFGKEIDPRVFKGINNELDLEYSMRNFYTTASTTIPNDQEGFGAFLYGGMRSAKEGDETALLQDNPRSGALLI